MKERMLITGASGFLGTAVLKELQCAALKAKYQLETFRSREFDLLNPSEIKRLLAETQPTTVVHLAATVGGIGFNQALPGTTFYNNILMGVQLIDACRRVGVEHFILAGTVCSYPKHCSIPFREAELWSGYPEETNAPYGIAKRALITQLQAYQQQYGFAWSTLLFVNLYGPGDNFDLEHSHVIPGMIRKFHEAKEKRHQSVTLWGDGSASREFLFVQDAARAIRLAVARGPTCEPLNIGTGDELRISALADIVADVVGYRGEIVWDRTRPNGQPRRRVDAQRAKDMLEFSASTSLREGLQRTYAWFLESRHSTEENASENAKAAQKAAQSAGPQRSAADVASLTARYAWPF